MTSNERDTSPRAALRVLIPMLIVTQLLPVIAARALTPAPHVWSRVPGGAAGDYCTAAATSPSDHVITAGSFGGTVDFGGGNLVSSGNQDVFLASYSPAGEHLWSQRFGSTLSDEANAVAVDGSGGVIVTGFFTGTVNFGGGNLISAGADDIFVAKYSSTGAHQWSLRFGSMTSDRGYGVRVDGSGNVIVMGHFNGTVNFGGGNLVSAGGNDIFLAKYSSTGVHQWSQRNGGTGVDAAVGLAVDAAGNIALTGQFLGTANFGGSNLTAPGGGNRDLFIARYNASGTHQWSQSYGSTSGDDLGAGVAIDASGNVIVTGRFVATVDFGGGSLVSAGDYDIFLAKYSSAGAHLWSERFGGTEGDYPLALAVDSSGNLIATGYFHGTASFGGDSLVSAGLNDIFLASYDSSGIHQWSRRFGGTVVDVGFAVTVDAGDNVIAAGRFEGTTNFGGGDVTSVGFSDTYVAKYAWNSAEPLITSIVDVPNDQGRTVKIRFDRSGHDAAGSFLPVLTYEAYRRDDAPPASGLWIDPAGLPGSGLLDDGWTQVGSVAAHGQSSYGIDVPTVGDSTVALGPYDSAFFIRAATASPHSFFDSPPDSGYSLDNLAPPAPTSLVYNANELDWDESPAADFDYFTVHGSNTSTFSSATVVEYTVAPSLDVSGSPYAYFFVTATDFSGNEGNPATIHPSSAVGDAPSRYVLSVWNHPNPFNQGTSVSYTVPARGPVNVAVYDARGSLVTRLVDGEEHDAGPYRIRWDGRSDGGAAVPAGVYFARIEHGGSERFRKLLRLN